PGSRSRKTLPSGSGSSTKSFLVPWPLRNLRAPTALSAPRGALADLLEPRQPLLEVRADHLVHALEQAHHLHPEGAGPGHRPGHPGAVALGGEQERRDRGGLERLDELQVDLDLVRLVRARDGHAALAGLAV